MATIAAKVDEATARALRRKAKAMGKTPSQVTRELIEEFLAPPSQEWAKALQKLPRLPRRGRIARMSDDELNHAIDTTV